MRPEPYTFNPSHQSCGEWARPHSVGKLPYNLSPLSPEPFTLYPNN